MGASLLALAKSIYYSFKYQPFMNKTLIMGVHLAAAPSNRNLFTWIVREALNTISDKIKLKLNL